MKCVREMSLHNKRQFIKQKFVIDYGFIALFVLKTKNP